MEEDPKDQRVNEISTKNSFNKYITITFIGLRIGPAEVQRVTIPRDYKIKRYLVEKIIKRYASSSFSSVVLTYGGYIVTEEDTPRSLIIAETIGIEVYMEVVTSLKNPGTMSEVFLLVQGEEYGFTDIGIVRMNIDLRIPVKFLKEALVKALPALKLRFSARSNWALVHNRVLLDDNETLKGAGMEPEDFIGLVNIHRLHSVKTTFGTEHPNRYKTASMGSQDEIIIATQARDFGYGDNCLSADQDLRSRPNFITESGKMDIFIGPPRRNDEYKSTCPVVKFCGGFTDDTKVRDLITAYNQASEYRINRALKPDELVSDVLKHGSLDLYFCLVDQYYFAFLDIDGTPADLPPQTFVHPIVEVREDTRSIE